MHANEPTAIVLKDLGLALYIRLHSTSSCMQYWSSCRKYILTTPSTAVPSPAGTDLAVNQAEKMEAMVKLICCWSVNARK
jgi:hypothetical protein